MEWKERISTIKERALVRVVPSWYSPPQGLTSPSSRAFRILVMNFPDLGAGDRVSGPLARLNLVALVPRRLAARLLEVPGIGGSVVRDIEGLMSPLGGGIREWDINVWRLRL